MTTAGALDPDPFEGGYQLRAVAPLTRRDQEGQWTAAALPGQVDLGGQTATGPAESFVGTVLRGR